MSDCVRTLYQSGIAMIGVCENARWSRAYTLFTGNSILMLAWATIFVGDIEAGGAIVLYLLSLTGCAVNWVWWHVATRHETYLEGYKKATMDLEAKLLQEERGGQGSNDLTGLLRAVHAAEEGSGALQFTLLQNAYLPRRTVQLVPLVFLGVFVGLFLVSLWGGGHYLWAFVILVVALVAVWLPIRSEKRYQQESQNVTESL